MAKIIYGVSGQGFGHSTRSREVLKYLTNAGHQVLVLTYDQALFFLQKDFDILEIPGVGLSYKNNKLVYWRTIYKNARQLVKQSRHWDKIMKRVNEFEPDLFITDFEPLTAILAKLKNLPLISIDNQHQLTNTKISVTKKYRKDLLADKLVIKSMVWGAKYYLVTTFFPTPLVKKNTFLFPPLLRQEILDLTPTRGDYFLVYQNSDFSHIVSVIKKFKNYRFVVFGTSNVGQDGNIEYKSYDSSDQWLKYLAGCRAVIGTSGLSLITESLQLGKPYLAIPVKRQIEQVINAEYLEKMNYGRFCFQLTHGLLAEFITALPELEDSLGHYDRQDNSLLLAKLSQLIKELV